MKTVFFLLLAATSAALSQSIATAPIFEDIPADTVLAVFDDGVKFTMEQFRGVYLAMNPQMQQSAMNNRRAWLEQYALFRKLALLAEKQGLDKSSPTRDVIEFQRQMILTQAELNSSMNSVEVKGDEIVKAYDQDKDKFKQVQVKVIYISFIPASMAQSGQKGLTEEQAKAKAEKLTKEIRAGADFKTLVKANSDDQTSAQKDGDFGTLRRTDNIPDAIRTAVFALNQGEVSDPVRQPNGFYILKAEAVVYRPLTEVRDEIYNELKLKHHQEWLDKTRAETKVKTVNEAFFTRPAPAGGAPPAGKKK